MKLPIDPEIIRKNAYLPDKLAQLSYKNPEAAMAILREWGEGRKAITQLWDSTIAALKEKEEVSA